MRKTFLALLLVLTAVCSCKSQYELLLESTDTNAKYLAAFDYFNQGKYSKSAALFESMSLATAGTERGDTVQYYLGLSNYNFRDYSLAETNFEKFLSTYPLSPFADQAQFLRVDCLYRSTLRYELDQTPTYKALAAISEYLVNYPNGANVEMCNFMIQELGERLDKKAYENALLYYKLEDYLASRVAFKNILKDDADNVYREDILYYTAMSSYKYADMSVPAKQKERYMIFVDDYFSFIGEFPESSYRKDIDRVYNKVKEKI